MSWINAIKRMLAIRKSLPDGWEDVVARWFPGLPDLAGEERERFETHLKIFFITKHFFGARDLKITEEMRLVISASAARVARNLPFNIYDRLTEVVVYPASYAHPDRDDEILGEAHHWGTMVLSWDSVDKGIKVSNDGRDTSIHELAHVLDVADGSFDGVPEMEHGSEYGPWVRVMSRYFHKLREGELRGDLLREYGATNEAEFFAVASEVFFEKPKFLRRNAPDLYEQLKIFYKVDPAEVGDSLARSV